MLVVLAALVSLLPYRALRPLGSVLAFLAFDLLRIRRKHVLFALDRAGLDARFARDAYRNLGAGALELLWLAGRKRTPLDAIARVEGWEKYEAARALGKGVVVATAHTGNWDLAACACAARTDLAVVTKRLSSRSFDRFWQSTRAHRGLELIAAPDGAVMAPVRARLAQGKAVALLIDQDPERTHGVIEAPFLGERALHDTMPATLAARSGAPIVVAFAHREPDGRHMVEVVDVLIPPPRAGRAWIDEATRSMAASLETFVRARPSTWLWLHRRWKTQRAQGPRKTSIEENEALERCA